MVSLRKKGETRNKALRRLEGKDHDKRPPYRRGERYCHVCSHFLMPGERHGSRCDSRMETESEARWAPR
jgi:hypothetical protein